ncbi:tetratricopeptide repeat protein [bacterium]|nr:tetratricopeptide repeat protein [bacterium]
MDFAKVLEKQWKLLLGSLGVVIVIGAVFTLISVKATQKEKSAQESYFAVEKKLIDLKTKKATPPTKDQKTEVVDFTQVKQDLEKVMIDYPGSVASQMAGLHLANLLVEDKNFDLALTTLQKIENKDKGLVNTLIQQQIGQLLADKEKCQEAITVWQKIVERKEAAFIHNETQIQQALCYTKLNDLKKAEEILTNLANKSANPEMGANSSSKEAEKYLRLIQFKKASGT